MRDRLRGLVGRIFDAVLPALQAGNRGREAEGLAAHYLQARGARVLARNVRCRGGEIDLVIEDAGTIAFVEVRLRSRADHGGASASITPAKRARLVLAARYWLGGTGRRHAARPCRFDAVLLDSLEARSITWLRGAFEAAG